jgi:hypothetical protein
MLFGSLTSPCVTNCPFWTNVTCAVVMGASSIIFTLKTFSPSIMEVVRTSIVGELVSFLNWLGPKGRGVGLGCGAGGGIGIFWALACCSYTDIENPIEKHESDNMRNLLLVDRFKLLVFQENNTLMKLTIAITMKLTLTLVSKSDN